MEFTARQSSSRVIAIMMAVMLLLLILSLTTTLVLAWHNRQLVREQKTIVTPMAFTAPFSLSTQSAGAAWLEMMALSFLSLRLNVSPATVEAQHQLLLSFVNPAVHADFRVLLAEEAERIRQLEVSSAFHQRSVQVIPAENRVLIRGVLKTWIGSAAADSEEKRWSLKMDYDAGQARIVHFMEVTDAKG